MWDDLGMSWILLALLSSSAKASHQVLTKLLVRQGNPWRVAVLGQLATAIAAVPLLAWCAWPTDQSFHAWAWGTIVGNVVAIVMMTYAIARTDVSYALPFLAVTPLVTAGMDWTLTGETLSLLGLLGIAATVLGALTVGARSARDWLSGGGRRALTDPGVRLVLLVSLIYGFSSVCDKEATRRADPMTFVTYGALGRALLLLPSLWFTRAREDSGSGRRQVLGIFILGVVFLLEHLSQMAALVEGNAAYVISVKRLSILQTSLVGMLFLGEPRSLYRLGGALLMVGGAVLIYLQS